MGKLLKYEFKKTAIYFLYLILGGLVASFLFLVGVKTLSGDDLSPGVGKIDNPGLVFPITILLTTIIIVGIVIAFIFYVVTNFKRDLYRECSLLKFTLPIDGKDFLNSKLINITLWTIITDASILVGAFFFSKLLLPNINKAFIEGFKAGLDIADVNISHIIILGILLILQSIFSLMMLYFSITFAKSVFKNSKSGILWFLVYLVMSSILAIGNYFINIFAPYRLEFYSRIQVVNRSVEALAESPLQVTLLSFNIANAILYLVVGLIFYFTTIYMLNHKADF
ncbi:hypothetical protein [Lagierella sp.]|uniref:hypothetical protein n=1 Tax=Lagierella sp. TaxID=2849657 RepID=UPI00260DC33F|nr:hypothetical protein [Lagierella sp.]